MYIRIMYILYSYIYICIDENFKTIITHILDDYDIIILVHGKAIIFIIFLGLSRPFLCEILFYLSYTRLYAIPNSQII